METDSRTRVSDTYNAAADHYDDPALSFWDRFGGRTVARLSLKPGSQVLDACCGAGASALPAAQAVGPTGSVLAIDLASGLLEIGRAKAARRGISNVQFRLMDMTEPGLPEHSFDAVICVFGIFFVTDMVGAAARLWRLVRPGGKLAVTTWGRNVFEPADSIFWDAVRAERPDLYRAFSPWERISDPPGLLSVLRDAGVEAPEIVPERGEHPVRSVEDFWTIAMGSGYRGTLEALDPDQRRRVRETCVDWMRRHDVRHLGADVIYAVATRPPVSKGEIP